MEFGRRCSEKVSVEITELFVSKYGYREIDTAIMYAEGETEKIMGRFDAALKVSLVFLNVFLFVWCMFFLLLLFTFSHS